MRLCWSSPLQRAPPPTPHRPSQAKTPEARQPTEPFPLQACKMTSEAAKLPARNAPSASSCCACVSVLSSSKKPSTLLVPLPPVWCSVLRLPHQQCFMLRTAFASSREINKVCRCTFFPFSFPLSSFAQTCTRCLPAASEELFALSRCVCSVCGGYDTRSAVEQRCILLLQRREWAV